VIAVTNTATTKALWYLTRGTGLVALLLLTASVVLGIMESVRWARPRWPKLLTAGLHKNVSLLVLAFLGLHIVTAVADGFAPIGWLAVVVPFQSTYRPLWLGFGAIAVDLLLAITITSLLRQHIGYRVWRAVHLMAYACWPVALLHGLGTGSDTRLGWVLFLSLGCLALVVAAAWWRVAVRPPDTEGVRPLAVLASAVASIAIIGWLMAGPLRPGWARRAGTPAALISGRPATTTPAGTSGNGNASSATSPPSTSGKATSSAIQIPFQAAFRGTVTQQSGGGDDGRGRTTVNITGTLSGGASGALRVVLSGRGIDGGGVEMESSRATLGPLSSPSQYQGQITTLQGTDMQLQLRDASGHSVTVALHLQINGDGSATGTVQAQ